MKRSYASILQMLKLIQIDSYLLRFIYWNQIRILINASHRALVSIMVEESLEIKGIGS